MLNGLDLFSGIGGLSLALSPWADTIAYCENNRYAQSVLLSRMAAGTLDMGPIWDDVRTFSAAHVQNFPVDIITAGFPCQDISVAGTGKGLEGQRSGLFYEVARIASEIRPQFVFLENVPRITSLGGTEVVKTLTSLGYDTRWCVISAKAVGANHKRERWFLLGNAHHNGFYGATKSRGNGAAIQHDAKESQSAIESKGASSPRNVAGGTKAVAPAFVADADSQRRKECNAPSLSEREGLDTGRVTSIWSAEWWEVEPALDRVADGISHRVDRVKCLGNAVVPLQAREAFKALIGWPECS
jgi:DNA (cytosine-5)-methyltransferase 1